MTQATSSIAQTAIDPLDIYRSKPIDKSGHVKTRSWRMVEGKMRYDEKEPEEKKKQLKTYRSPKVVRDDN